MAEGIVGYAGECRRGGAEVRGVPKSVGLCGKKGVVGGVGANRK